MVIKELDEILKKNNIRQGDTLCVFSDITSFGIPSSLKKEIKKLGPQILLDSYIDTFMHAVGEDGLLVMPTFSYKETRGKHYDLSKTKTTLGVLNEHFRKQKGVARSLHPIFSFAAWGRDAKNFLHLESFDCFGKGSIFDKLYNNNASYILFGIDMQNSATFIYYSEQKYGVPYRYFKNFKETIINGEQKYIQNVKYFVRNRDAAPDDNFYRLEKRALDTDVAKLSYFELGRILTIKSHDIDALIQKELTKNEAFLIST